MNLKNLNLLIIYVFLHILFGGCKTNKNISGDVDLKLNETDMLIKQNRLDEAHGKLEILYKMYSSNAEIVRRLGFTKYHINDKWGALPILIKADSIYGGSNFDLIYSIGLCAFEIGKYDIAGVYVDRYIKVGNDEEKILRAQLLKKRIEKLSNYIRDSTVVSIHVLPNTINTENDEFLAFPTLDNQTLLFTRRFKTSGKVVERLMFSQFDGDDWVESKYFEDFGIATGSLSGDGNILVSTSCERNQSIGSCDIMIAYKQNEKWSQSKNMTDLINSIEWDAQPSISSDGKMIFFSSSRKGGRGGRDIYYSKRGANGWQAPTSISDNINSPANEESPFIHADNSTLYFRSDREDGLGSYDNYVSRYDELTNTWSKPENLGYPINTVGDDGALTIGADGVTAYITSDRGSLMDQKPNFDIFTFKLPEKYKAQPTTYARVEAKDAENKKILLPRIVILDTRSLKIIFDGYVDSGGVSTIPLQTKKEYSILVELNDYYPISLVYMPDTVNNRLSPMIISVEMKKIDSKNPIVLNNILFEVGSARLIKNLDLDLKYLLNLVKSNQALSFKIVGHTDNTGTEEFNLKLSIERAKSVMQYLVENGIEPSRISVVGKGESEPITTNETEEGRRRNRRTEIFIIK